MPKEFLRLPYTVSQVTELEGDLLVLIYPISADMVSVKGLSERFASFIEDHCECRCCRKPVRQLSAHGRCARNEAGALWAVSPEPLKDWARALFQAELNHRLKFELLHKPDPGRDMQSPEVISGLLNAQSGRCFHCLKALLDADTGQFRAIEDEVDGTVLVCPACSRLHSTGLLRQQQPPLGEPDPTLRQAHKTMQARVRQFKRTQSMAA